MSTRTVVTVVALATSATSAQQLVYEPALPVEGLGGGFGNQLAAADLDGDGLGDLVDASAAGPLRVAIGAGDGVFVVSPLAGRASPFRLVDVDGDDILDIVHPTLPVQTVAWSRGLGDGSFEEAVSILPAGTSSSSLGSLDAGDVNGDGVVDVAYVDGIFGVNRTVLLGQGDGTFVSTPDLTGALASSVQLGDVDGDGLDDLIAGSLGGDDWLRSLGDGSFAAPLPAPPGMTVDLIGDAAVEFVAVESVDAHVDIVVRAWIDGGVSELARIPTPFGEFGTPEVSATDVDGDELLDLVLLAADRGFVFRQQAGVFEFASAFTATSDLNGIAAAVVTTTDGPRDLAFQGTFNGVALAENVTYADDTPFTDLGGNTPGSIGFPTQVLDADGADLSVRVLAAAPSAPVFAIWGGSLGAPLGLSATSPSPDRILGPFTTSPLGTFEVAASDALPLGLDVYAQWWIVDPSTGLASTSTVLIDG